jgi:hypothetical protein
MTPPGEYIAKAFPIGVDVVVRIQAMEDPGQAGTPTLDPQLFRCFHEHTSGDATRQIAKRAAEHHLVSPAEPKDRVGE